MKRWYLKLILCCCFVMPVWANTAADVQKASQSVYRVWLGVPLPTGFVKQTDGEHIQALQNQLFAEQVPLKGLSLRQKQSGKIKNLSGEGMLFQHSGQYYLLVASGSAYAVSNQGHLVSNAKLADNRGSAEVMFVDVEGMRDVGANGGQAEVFVLDKHAPNASLILHTAKIIARDNAHDLAILQAQNLPTTPLQLADSQFAKTADRVFALGVEGEFDYLSGKQNAIDRVDYFSAISHEGKLDKRVKEKQVNFWLHSANISGSLTGGALINQCGQVLGTNQINEKKQNGFKSIDVGELLPMLRKHSIPFQVFQGRCGGVVAKAENIADGAERVVQAAQHNPRGWLTVLGLAVLTLVAVIIAMRMLWWLLRKRKTTPQRAVSANPNPYPPPAPPVQPTVQPVHHHHTTPVKPIGTTPNIPDTFSDIAITLQPLTSSLQAIEVKARPIIVGRQTGCDVILSNHKISRQHAKFWQEKHQLWVQDLNSTNGTWVNGVSINSPTRLKAGDIVQLSADENVARFRLPETPSNTFEVPHTFIEPIKKWQLEPLQPHLPVIQLTMGKRLNIGRNHDNDVVLSASVISARHCCVWVDNHGSLMLQDLNSTNGTFINTIQQGREPVMLQNGQTIYLANEQTAYRVVQLG